MTGHRKHIGGAPTAGILCHLCRQSTALTKAHVPPKCAGNRGKKVERMRPTISDEVMSHDRPLQGGLWLETLCASCNGLASKYDPAYGELTNALTRFDFLTRRPILLPHSRTGVPAVPIAPGRVARSLIYGMVALAPSMQLVQGEFLDHLLEDDDQLRLPPGMQPRVARITHRECRISSAYSMMQVAVRRQLYDVFAEVCFYPFIWVLCSPQVELSLGPNLVDLEEWGDATDWLRFSRNATRRDLRDVLDRLPITRHPTLRNRDHWVDLYSSDTSYVLEGRINS